MAYTKLFNSIITSTIWTEDDQTRIVWITMLACADKNGEVQASIPGLARLAGVPVEACETAIVKFLSPDKHSRTKDDEGRRVEEIEGGWSLLNFRKYREMASKEDLQASEAARKARYRAKLARNVPKCPVAVRGVSTVNPHIAEADTHSNSDSVPPKDPPARPRKPVAAVAAESSDHTHFVELWTDAYPQHHGGEKYAFQGAKDGAAVKQLLATSGRTPAELMTVAVTAWKHPTGFNAKMAASISGFNSKFNDIRNEVAVARPPTGIRENLQIKTLIRL